MRRKRTVKPTRHRTVGIAMFFVVSAIAAIALAAAEWRESVTGVVLDVRGVSITSKAVIADAVALNDSSSLTTIDLLEVKRRILANPYIRDVDLMRDPPRTLVVNVTERKPIAMLINVQAADWLVDEDGYVLPAVHAPEVYDVPVITGAGDLRVLKPGVRIVSKKVQKALQVLRTARGMGGGIFHQFSEVHVAPKRDLVLYTIEAGVPVILGPVVHIENKLRAFNTFWENVAMKYDPAALEYVDLRWSNQVVTRWRGTTDAPAQAEQSDTLAVRDTLFIKE
ncbi:MAG: cell division protein FtsQ/DivIB [Bacteroidia bacterium]|nr:cell division protein FtsQ/DivIB [Bacteroidia bacterium]